MFAVVLASIVLMWYAVIITIALCGFYSIYTKFAYSPKTPLPRDFPQGMTLLDIGDADNASYRDLEPVTIIRPVKGLDPELASCLELSFLQRYPSDKIQIIFCVADAHDPAVPLLHGLLAKYLCIDAQILVLEPDNGYFGPNPKVNNLAKGFIAAKHDLIWIMDLNVWASRHILENSVRAMMHNTNCGENLGNTSRKVKLVHHVPLALALDHGKAGLGALLDEMFLFTSHLKFYVGINNISVAPCVNGKLNLYRKSDLDHAVAQIPRQNVPLFSDPHVVKDALRISLKGPGHSMEFFAKYIGEDHMIGIALWEYCMGRTALTGDVVVQPLESQKHANSLREYCNRRIRWLRVRKYMVLVATLVEPTTESVICGMMGTFALSRLLWQREFCMWFFVFHMCCWLACDYVQSRIWARHISAVARTGPAWLHSISPSSRSTVQWLRIWFMREVLALPIWISAMVGHEIEWRGKPFRIKKDLSVVEL